MTLLHCESIDPMVCREADALPEKSGSSETEEIFDGKLAYKINLNGAIYFISCENHFDGSCVETKITSLETSHPGDDFVVTTDDFKINRLFSLPEILRDENRQE